MMKSAQFYQYKKTNLRFGILSDNLKLIDSDLTMSHLSDVGNLDG
jgi:hypothetical protein